MYCLHWKEHFCSSSSVKIFFPHFILMGCSFLTFAVCCKFKNTNNDNARKCQMNVHTIWMRTEQRPKIIHHRTDEWMFLSTVAVFDCVPELFSGIEISAFCCKCVHSTLSVLILALSLSQYPSPEAIWWSCMNEHRLYSCCYAYGSQHTLLVIVVWTVTHSLHKFFQIWAVS